jgi:hypothetical protein
MYDSGIVEALPREGPTAVVRFKTLWNDHYQFCRDLIGIWTGTAPSNISRVAPFQYPPSPNLICTEIESIVPLGKTIVPAGLSLPWIARKYAVITARFSVPSWSPFGDTPYYKINFGASGEFLTIPETTYRFNDGTPTNTPIGILIPQLEITYTRYRVPFPPIVQMMMCEGKVNNGPFNIGGFVAAAQSLLFMAGHLEVTADSFGNMSYECEYKFLYKYVPWNWFFHPNRTTGFALVTDGNGNAPYGTADFSILPG